MSLNTDENIIKLIAKRNDIKIVFEIPSDSDIEEIYSVFRAILLGLGFHKDTIEDIMPSK
jgi:MinD superfamily P-loop ATPase